MLKSEWTFKGTTYFFTYAVSREYAVKQIKREGY